MALSTRRPGRPTNDGTPGINRAALAKAMMATTWPEWSLKTRCRYGSQDDFARFTGYAYKQLETAMLDAIKLAKLQQPNFDDLNELKGLSVALFEQHNAHLLDGGPRRRSSRVARPAAYDQAMHTVVKHLFAKLRYASVRGTTNIKQALDIPAASKDGQKKLVVVLKAPTTSTAPVLRFATTSIVHNLSNRFDNSLSRAYFVDTTNTAFEPAIPRRSSKRLILRSFAANVEAPRPSLATGAVNLTSKPTGLYGYHSAYTLPLPHSQHHSSIPLTQHCPGSEESQENNMIITSFMRPGETADLLVQCNEHTWHLNSDRASRLSEFLRTECQKQAYNSYSTKRINMSNESPITVQALLQFTHETDYDFLASSHRTLQVPAHLHADHHFDIAEIADTYDRTYQLGKVAEQKFIAAVEAMEYRESIADLIHKVFRERSSDRMRAAVARHCLKHVVGYTHNQAFWKVYISNSGFAIKFLQAVCRKEVVDAGRRALMDGADGAGAMLLG